MKKILLLIFSSIFFSSFAQLDREHWFAPMVDRVGNTSQYQSIYMSTNEITPFKVDIYSNNIVVGSVTISKNNPVKYRLFLCAVLAVHAEVTIAHELEAVLAFCLSQCRLYIAVRQYGQ